jgi:hypothetical protein
MLQSQQLSTFTQLCYFAFSGFWSSSRLQFGTRHFSTHRILGRISNVLMPFILIFSVAMLSKEYHEHLASGASVIAARNSEFLSAAQLTLLATFYGLSIACIRKRNVSAHMRYMICIVLILLPAGLARTLGYWFNVRQSSSQTLCFLLIDAFLIVLIILDKRRKVSPPPYIAALLAYIVIEACWVSLGRPV